MWEGYCRGMAWSRMGLGLEESDVVLVSWQRKLEKGSHLR